MGVSSLTPDNSGPTLDFSAQGLQKLEPNFPCQEDTHTLILDHNHIIKLEHLDKSHRLQQLSVANNRLVRVMGVSRLTELRVLNLPNNSIGYIEGLKDLVHLEWLNLAGNNIKVMDQLSNCSVLQHLDLSDNNISQIGDLSKLSILKTLLLHGNIITTLRTGPAHLPPSLHVLSLAENEIRDLNEVSYLASLPELEQLSVMSNPCVLSTPSLPGYDCRPYVISWCLSLKILDGYIVSQKEGLKAEWLYSQGKGRLFRPGQHVQLVQYLASVCPLTSASALQSAEDAKLEKILSKQRLHQSQLLQQTQRVSQNPARPMQLDVEQQHPRHAQQSGLKDRLATPEAGVSRKQIAEPALKVNTWVAGDHSYSIAPCGPAPASCGETLYLEDVQTDEDKLSFSLLSSDTALLHPPVTMPSTKKELDKSDSLAAESTGAGTGQGYPYTEPEKELVLGDCSDCTVVEVSVQQAQRCEAAEAALKIQAWWRGYWTRRHHLQAREVRAEIRLRRMQEHITFLSAELECVRKQQEEERLQRMVQEEAVKFLWKQLQSMQEWQHSMEERLGALGGMPVPTAIEHPTPESSSAASPYAAPGPLFLPDSGFQSSGLPHGVLDILSSEPGDFVETEVEDQDCILLQQYLCSVQQCEDEEQNSEGAGVIRGLPLSPAPQDEQPNL
ncbi:centrosomal protein of 97 kDa [Paramormyrops kingsleyae]|uniref:centrosomal protein of 97 kDa n=1 Tax=Paramormyrops kingsleyae TaxID=1676925 RepID=UPI000CD65D70|nr:centrosomal protein of 97 kDa [Paramormyrops kingsleyae]